MKLKIRGLVFVGFAAAVFASSAMADDPNPIVPPSLQSPTPHPDALKKTVVSQDYTDETFQERASTANGYALAEDKDGNVADKAALIGWAYGQNGEAKEWVKLEGKKQADASNEYVEIVHEGSGINSKHYVQMHTNSITTETGGTTGAQKITAAGDQNASDLEQNRLTTAKAVYDFVMDGAGSGTGLYQPKATSTTGAQVGIKTGDTSTWYTLAAGQNGVVLNTFTDNTPYARVYRDDDTTNGNVAGVYVDLNHSRVVASSAYTGDSYKDGMNLDNLASSTLGEDGMALVTAGAVYDLLDRESAGNTTTIGSGSTNGKVPTSKNVYDYAQPRFTTNSADGSVTVGYKASGSDSTWTSMTEGTYVELALSNGAYTVDVNANKITTSGAQIAGANSTNEDLTDLPNVEAVRQYVQSVTNGNTLPTMPLTCQATGVHCALVSIVDTPANDQTPGVTHLEWVVMAGN